MRWEQFCDAWYSSFSFWFTHVTAKLNANNKTEIKLVVAAVYSNFRTHIVNDEGIEQTDGYTCGPAGNKLFLRFEKVEA